MYHQTESSKIRVEFDCIVKFQGKPISKVLLSGPDLINQRIGVLTRFREEKITFLADLEAMYYQVQVSEDQQSFLKFLWFGESWYGKESLRRLCNVHSCFWWNSIIQLLKLCLTQDIHGKLAALEKLQQVLFVTVFMVIIYWTLWKV